MENDESVKPKSPKTEDWIKGWVESVGRGKMFFSSNEEGSILTIESSSPTNHYICISDQPVVSTNYNLDFKMKISKKGDNGLIILNFKKNKNRVSYICITINVQKKFLKLEKIMGNTNQIFGQISLPKLVNGRFLKFSIKVKKCKISLLCNHKEVFGDICVSKDLLDGQIGIGVLQSKIFLRDWKISFDQPELEHSAELPNEINREFSEIIQNDIIQRDLNVHWDDIAELGNAKKYITIFGNY